MRPLMITLLAVIFFATLSKRQSIDCQLLPIYGTSVVAVVAVEYCDQFYLSSEGAAALCDRRGGFASALVARDGDPTFIRPAWGLCTLMVGGWLCFFLNANRVTSFRTGELLVSAYPWLIVLAVTYYLCTQRLGDGER
ncbi:MAG: hypothetical protein ACI9G1_002434 [Pirellulaceae bacterium]|jgi:hypothetical protein